MKITSLFLLIIILVNISDAKKSSIPIACNSITSGNISTNNRADLFRFTLNTPSYVKISTCGTNFDTELTLKNSNNITIDYNDDSGECGTNAVINNSTLNRGSYTFIIRGYNDGNNVGVYNLSLQCEENTNPTMPTTGIPVEPTAMSATGIPVESDLNCNFVVIDGDAIPLDRCSEHDGFLDLYKLSYSVKFVCNMENDGILQIYYENSNCQGSGQTSIIEEKYYFNCNGYAANCNEGYHTANCVQMMHVQWFAISECVERKMISCNDNKLAFNEYFDDDCMSIRNSSFVEDLSDNECTHYSECDSNVQPSTTHAINEDTTYNAFTIQWKPQICYKNAHPSCFSDVIPNITIHGIWPNYYSGWFPSDCPGNQLEYKQIQHLETELAIYWPTLFLGGFSNFEFWSHEWAKHGTCWHYVNVTQYFEYALSLIKNDYNNIQSILATDNIYPSSKQTYSLSQVTESVSTGLNQKVVLRCIANRFISEFWVCRDWFGDKIDCPDVLPSNCDDTVVLTVQIPPDTDNCMQYGCGIGFECDSISGKCIRDCNVFAIDEYLLQCSNEFQNQESVINNLQTQIYDLELELLNVKEMISAFGIQSNYNDSDLNITDSNSEIIPFVNYLKDILVVLLYIINVLVVMYLCYDKGTKRGKGYVDVKTYIDDEEVSLQN